MAAADDIHEEASWLTSGTSPSPALDSKYDDTTEDRQAESRRIKLAAVLVLLVSAGVALLVAILGHIDKNAPGTDGNPDTNTSSVIGWLAVMSSIVVFGSYGILIKSPEVQEAKVDTMIFQCYSTVGISGVSFLVLIYAPWHFSWWGIAGGGGLVLIQVFAFNAISSLGYAVAPAIWAGLTIVVSFLWGSLKFHEKVDSVVGSVFSLALLCCGIGGIASCQTDVPNKIAAALGFEPSADSPLLEPEPTETEAPKISKTLGACFCVVVGLLNGSLMVPFHYLNDELSSDQPPITYLGSFALGVVLMTAVFFVLYFYFPVGKPPEWHFKAAFIPGVVTGALWGIGNFCATYATQYLGNTVGFPLTQGCIIFNGLWGIFFYKEITGTPKIAMFGISAVVIIGGAVLLTISKGS